MRINSLIVKNKLLRLKPVLNLSSWLGLYNSHISFWSQVPTTISEIRIGIGKLLFVTDNSLAELRHHKHHHKHLDLEVYQDETTNQTVHHNKIHTAVTLLNCELIVFNFFIM